MEEMAGRGGSVRVPGLLLSLTLPALSCVEGTERGGERYSAENAERPRDSLSADEGDGWLGPAVESDGRWTVELATLADGEVDEDGVLVARCSAGASDGAFSTARERRDPATRSRPRRLMIVAYSHSLYWRVQ